MRKDLQEKILEAKSKNLKSLDLSILGVTDKDLEDIVDEIQDFEEINLSGNMIKKLPKNFRNLKNLRKLSLATNYIKIFPEEIGYLENLVFLDIRNNLFEKLNTNIVNLQNLTHLYLKGNNLKIFPKEIFELKNLEVLGLVKTGISEIPKDIEKLQNLKSLWIGKNKIKKIPKELMNLKKLENITLDENLLPIDKEILSFEKNPKIIFDNYLKNLKNIEKIKIAIGTQNPAKVGAIEEAIEKCVYFEGKDIEIIPLKVESGISDMPITIEENMTGAENRAKNCKKVIEADFYIGMEGGTNIFGEKAYLFGVVYILNKNGKGHFGFSNMMEVPEFFRQKIYDENLELGPVLSEATREENASKKGGAFGHWSDGMLTRKDQFVLAFLSGIVPFFNKYYK